MPADRNSYVHGKDIMMRYTVYTFKSGKLVYIKYHNIRYLGTIYLLSAQKDIMLRYKV
jgi:hypothetical protein